MKDPKLYWKGSRGKVKVSKMGTTHLINTVKLVNKMAKNNNEYPECYDNMYIELNNRGIDTDFELDNMFPNLDKDEEYE